MTTFKVDVRKASTTSPGAKPKQCDNKETVKSYTGPVKNRKANKVGWEFSKQSGV